MRQIGTIILILNTAVLFGQQLKMVVTTYPKSKDVKEVYYVLSSNKNVKDGEYYSFYKGELTTNELKTKNLKTDPLGFKEKGRYENNLKNGEWIMYKTPRVNSSTTIYNVKLEEGQYVKDRKIGIWKTYIENEKVVKQFDFDSNSELPTLVNVRWRYPSDARKNRVEGPVTVKVTYDNCEATDYEILADIGHGCGNAVVESLKEKRALEKKYGVKSTKCDIKDEIVDVQFKLDE